MALHERKEEVNLKNYTSGIPAHTTISYIEAYLADCGVSGIAKEFNANKQPSALYFNIDLGDKKYTIRLPANIEQVQEALWHDYCSSTRRPRKTKEDFGEQASRTAWKIQQDWVQVQMSLVKLKQADFRQVFLAYIWDGSKTYYEFLRGQGFKSLPERT
jgi:hypothetical protein